MANPLDLNDLPHGNDGLPHKGRVAARLTTFPILPENSLNTSIRMRSALPSCRTSMVSPSRTETTGEMKDAAYAGRTWRKSVQASKVKIFLSMNQRQFQLHIRAIARQRQNHFSV